MQLSELGSETRSSSPQLCRLKMSMGVSTSFSAARWTEYGEDAWWQLVDVYEQRADRRVFMQFKIHKDNFPTHYLWVRVEGTYWRPTGRTSDSRERDSISRSPCTQRFPRARGNDPRRSPPDPRNAPRYSNPSTSTWRSRWTTESSRAWGDERWSEISIDTSAGGNHNSDSRPNSEDRTPTPPLTDSWSSRSPRENPPVTSNSPWVDWRH